MWCLICLRQQIVVGQILRSLRFSFPFCIYSFVKLIFSKFLLLPDSFGDIYVGECFSAYIAVVNGVENTTFTNVSISVRLQTSEVAFDLYDNLPSADPQNTKTLNPAESMDMIVKHPLDELGTHTMRVSIAYTDIRTNEPKTLRKFYRFNVLSALNIETKCMVVDGVWMIQCRVTNATKNSLYITEVRIFVIYFLQFLCCTIAKTRRD